MEFAKLLLAKSQEHRTVPSIGQVVLPLLWLTVNPASRQWNIQQKLNRNPDLEIKRTSPRLNKHFIASNLRFAFQFTISKSNSAVEDGWWSPRVIWKESLLSQIVTCFKQCTDDSSNQSLILAQLLHFFSIFLTNISSNEPRIPARSPDKASKTVHK